MYLYAEILSSLLSEPMLFSWLFLFQKGNELFKKGQFEEAISCYTVGLQLDPCNVILAANRAMALLKMNRFANPVHL